MNKTQILGVVLLAAAITAYYLYDTPFPDFVLGLVAALGVGFIFKLIPFKKRDVAD